MLVWLFGWLGQYYTPFSAVSSLTLRALLAVITALVFSMFFGGRVIQHLRALKYGQAIRNDGPQSHLVKTGTPTMGGVLILSAIGVSTLLWARLNNPYVWILLVVMVIFGAVGWADDWLKIKYKDPKGLIARKKYFWLSMGALFVGVSLYYIATLQPDINTTREMQDLLIPIFKDWMIPFSAVPFGIGFIIFTYFVINLHVPYIPYNSEVIIVCGAMVGAGLGFLWFNAHPAQVFMGDVGALALGAMLGTIAVMTRQEIAFAIMGGLFVAEALSVMLQVGSYKLRKKRVFRMAPLHHHFEEIGWKETQVVTRFWIIAIILVILGLMTLKLR